MLSTNYESDAVKEAFSGFTGAAKALTDEFTAELNKMIELIVKIDTFVSSTSLSDFDDIIDTSSISDGMQSAVELGDALGDNPLLNAIDAEFQDEFGISTSSMLSVAQSLIRGNEPPILKVMVAFLTMPGRVESYLSSARTVRDQMGKLADFVESFAPGDDLQRASVITIPAEIIQKIENARNNLIRSMSYPFNSKLYMDNTEEIKQAAILLENVPWLQKATDSLTITPLLLLMNAMAVGVAPIAKVVKSASERVIEDINVILLTDLSIRSQSSAKYNTAKKAANRISQILSQMKNDDLDQLVMLPKYISILNVAYMLLKTGKPAADKSQFDFDRTKIRIQATTVRDIQASVRKMTTFLQRPYKLSALRNEITKLSNNIDKLQTEYDATVDFITHLEDDATWFEKMNLVRLLFKYLEDYAGALSLLADGSYAAILMLTDATGTSEGMAEQALTELSGVCEQYNLDSLAGFFGKKAAEMSKKRKAKMLKNEAKKEKRKSKALAKIKEINVLMEDTTEMSAVVAGLGATIGQVIGKIAGAANA